MIEYDELKIRVEPDPDGNYRVEAIGPDGRRANARFAVPISETELDNFVLRVGQVRRKRRAYGSAHMEHAKKLGAELHAALMNGPVRDVYFAAKSHAEARDRGLRITLALTDAPELLHIPWEFLYERPAFLAASIYTPVVRSLDLPAARPPRTIALPLRVLGVVSRPAGWDELDVDVERSKLEQALQPLSDAGIVELIWLSRATLPELERQIGHPEEIHILHFIGHGGYDERTHTGILVFEDARGGPHEVTGEELGSLLHDERSLRLAVLNSCEGARNSHVDPFSGVASALVESGIPAVIGMQFEITDEAAIVFAERMYEALGHGYGVDAAVAQARKAIFAAHKDDVEFGTPVLFTRAGETRLFRIETGEPAGSRRGGGVAAPVGDQPDRESLPLAEPVADSRSTVAEVTPEPRAYAGAHEAVSAPGSTRDAAEAARSRRAAPGPDPPEIVTDVSPESQVDDARAPEAASTPASAPEPALEGVAGIASMAATDHGPSAMPAAADGASGPDLALVQRPVFWDQAQDEDGERAQTAAGQASPSRQATRSRPIRNVVAAAGVALVAGSALLFIAQPRPPTGGASAPPGSSPGASAVVANPSPQASVQGVISDVCFEPPRRDGTTLSITEVDDVLREAWLDPYSELTGVSWSESALQDDASTVVRTQVDSGDVTLDVVSVPSDFGLEVDAEYLEPIDYSLIDWNEFPSTFAGTYRIAHVSYSNALLYAPARLGSDEPEDWSAFFDLEQFPGERAVWELFWGPLFEVALLADGVAPDELYPLDLERARAMLDTIDDALVFSESPGDELVSGSAAMAIAAPSDIDIDGTVEVQWRGQLLEAEYFVVPIGAPNGQAAMEFIAWTACASNNALPSGSGGEGYGPTNLLAEPLAERTDLIGMANLDEMSVFRDDEALAEQWADIEEAFEQVRADR